MLLENIETFLGEVGILGGGNFPREGFSGGELCRGILSEFLCLILFIGPNFYLPTQFYMWRCSRGTVREKFFGGRNFPLEEGGISGKMSTERRFLALFEKRSAIIVFFQMKVC